MTEYDPQNMAHNVGIAVGSSEVFKAVVAKVRFSYWVGPHKLHDGPSPYPHKHFPYAFFWGFREDRTRVPYGYVRGLIFQQDSLNSGTALMRWGLAAYRVERTEDVLDMPDAMFRRQVGKRNADIKLKSAGLSKNGARFEIKRDIQLTEQQHQLMNDCRAVFEQISAAPAAFSGQRGTASSGVQERTQLEQANQALGTIMDNFREGRRMIGEMLMSMIVQELGEREKVVVIEGDAVKKDRTVTLNRLEKDESGYTYLSNDVQRTLLQVQLEEVPSTAGYRSQQLYAFQEVIKTMPPQFQQAAFPYMVALMDTPYKREIVEALRAVGAQETPEQVEQRIKQEVQDALVKAGHDLKARELDIKERLTEAQIKDIVAAAVLKGVQAAFSAMQGGVQVAQMPMIAPIADVIMQGAGYQKPSPGGDEQRDSYKAKAEDAEARAEEARRQLSELQEQAQARADAGKPPTQQDQLVQKAQEAIDKGVDPSIFGDYGEEDLAKGFYELSRRSSEQMRAEVKAELMQELRAEIAPLLQRQQQDAASAHMNAILQVHPDLSSVLESTEFAGWVGKQPSYVQAAMSAVLDKGSSAQVVELLDSYKAATTQQSQKTSQATTPQAAAQKVLEQLKPPVPSSPSDIPGGRSGAGTLAERLQSMSEVDVFNAVNSGEITEEQLNRYLSRKS